MAGDKVVIVVDLYVRGRIMQLYFLADIGMRHAVVMPVFVKTGITVLVDRGDDMLLDLVTDGIKRTHDFLLDVLEPTQE